MYAIIRQVSLLLLLITNLVLPQAAAVTATETFNGEAVHKIGWEQLMPKDFSLEAIYGDTDQLANIDDFSDDAQQLLEKMMQAMQSAPVVPTMNNKMVKIPGYVVPVDGSGDRITGFFLVPYFGACIHAPPPPSNQIIYVHFEPGTGIENLYDAVWITGKLTTEVKKHELATSGYLMEAFRIEPYEE